MDNINIETKSTGISFRKILGVNSLEIIRRNKSIFRLRNLSGFRRITVLFTSFDSLYSLSY